MYRIVGAIEANELMGEGWEPLGGPVVYEGELLQAMVRRDREHVGLGGWYERLTLLGKDE